MKKGISTLFFFVNDILHDFINILTNFNLNRIIYAHKFFLLMSTERIENSKFAHENIALLNKSKNIKYAHCIRATNTANFLFSAPPYATE